ncbi:hypothetical protein ACLB2K_054781 [Fragaria x ananassa]
METDFIASAQIAMDDQIAQISKPDGCAAILTNHEDVVVEIFARLPVKTLMRFRCVCTTWRSLIADPHFVKKHMKYDAEKRRRYADAVLHEAAQHHGLGGFEGCNGIICVQVRKDFVLWNPCTGDHTVLPKPSGVSCSPQYYGFGYDEINDDYKVVKGSYIEIDDCGGEKPMIQVFSLRRGAWNTYPGPKNNCMRGQGGFVNGVPHWLWFEEWWEVDSTEIRPFSLAEEKFLEAMPIPWYGFGGILISGNHLCVYNDRGLVRILMMKEYGVMESWTEVLYLTFHTRNFSFTDNWQSQRHLTTSLFVGELVNTFYEPWWNLT